VTKKVEDKKKVLIELPKGTSLKDFQSFLEKHTRDEDQELVTMKSLTKPKNSCSNCGAWKPGIGLDKTPHCWYYSSTCVTAVFNHREPTRWIPRDN